MTNLFNAILLSISHCKRWILTIFIIYCVSCLTGIIMVHSGNSFALSYADKIVGNANTNDNASINYHKGNRFKAALIDFSGNLFIGSITQSFLGLGVIFPFFTTAYQGWIGGIISVDMKHQSRLIKPKTALYYIIVLILEWIPYSLTIGSGLALGIKTYKLNKGRKLFKYQIDQSSLKDVLHIYLFAIPIFFFASCFEFLSNWNN
ncbi:hypothetical protein FW778_17015 [Ginsengibacter hankyongi]|uniref:Stage II sporulation protein M n=1 Tax=Ginsengibacter hankyongi TaxID=2607284 RepID=A0A5J5ICS7_9BACT|nr:hypothetical protein [Ginsengibacter hankyongi]KAA9037130.1 hypothetical protein FW778_17015 [Ginsengibacter hankyongi]